MGEYEEFCNYKGLEAHRILDYLDVRFKTFTNCAEWMEKDDRCLHLWFEKLVNEIKKGQHKDVSQAEQLILKEFKSNYVTVKLCNKSGLFNFPCFLHTQPRFPVKQRKFATTFVHIKRLNNCKFTAISEASLSQCECQVQVLVTENMSRIE